MPSAGSNAEESRLPGHIAVLICERASSSSLVSSHYMTLSKCSSLGRPVNTNQLQQSLIVNLLIYTSFWINKSTSCLSFNLWFSLFVAMTFEALFMSTKDLIH